MKKIVMCSLTTIMVIFCIACSGNATKSEAGKDQASKEETTIPAKKEKKTIVCRVSIKEGQEAAFTNVAKKLVEATRQEAGNISYNLYQSPFDPQSFIFYEEYKDDDAFDFHANSDHFKAFAEAIPDMLAADLNIEQF